MKNRLCYIIYLIFLSFIANAQREADSFINGDCFQIEGLGCNTPNANQIIKFNEDSLEQIIEPLNLNLATYFSRAAFCDKNTGNLIFASNGWRLVNREGDILAEKLWRDDIPWPGDNPDTTMILNTLGPLFLNDPGDSTKAYLLYGQYKAVEYGSEITKADVLFTYAYLDIPSKSMISKNNIILTDTTTSGDMTACRHANGRDWWVIKAGVYEDEYYTGLLGPNGLNMSKMTVPEIIHRGQYSTSSFFSHDGLKFLHYTGKGFKYLHEYDFDRCTGTLSNPIVHDLSDSLYFDALYACTISPDGSKFYITKGGSPHVPGTLQYDLITQTYTYISNFAGGLLLAPNGKTILATSFFIENNQFYRFYSEINYPNAYGTASNYVPFKYPIDNNDTFVFTQNYANFRLGAETGSICDSLSIGFPTLEKGNVVLDAQVYPNPFTNEFTIQLKTPPSSALQLQVYDGIGRLVHQSSIVNKTTTINTQELAQSTGLFYITLTDVNGKVVFGKKMVKINKE